MGEVQGGGIPELVSLGVQKFTKEMSGVIWEGSRLAVDGFQFADGVFVDMINVSTTTLLMSLYLTLLVLRALTLFLVMRVPI